MTFNYKQWYQQNKAQQNKRGRDDYRKLKQQVYQDYSFVCEKPGCNECNIEELTMKPMADTPEAKALRKVKAGDKRLRYMKAIGYKKEFGIVVRCKKCGQDSRQRKRTKSVKVKPQRSLGDRLKGLFKRSPERKRSKRNKKDKKKREKWLKARVQSLESKIAVDQAKLEGYKERLKQLQKTA